ncbi:MAG: pyruvate formate-lyase-activating protein [Tissierellaceae bacterium]|jgi:pyruvate formate lyase activating enzyme|nr:pyruvate formate lyase-activating protein [Tissierellia bacterium]
MTKARLHSIETMGLVDGPGIRTIFFLQGCPLRCAYCHNPDSQTMYSNKLISPDEVLQTALRYKSYYDSSGGGVTFSGGEPLIQGEFLVETLKLLKEAGINTAIDTSGFGDERYYKEILKLVDVVILDIKHFDDRDYKSLTGRSKKRFNKFLSYLDDFHGTIWLRHVMVPSITDNEESMYSLFKEISYLAEKIDRFEILPYHRMGIEKYEELNREYPLKDVPEMDKGKAKNLEELINKLLEEERDRIRLRKEIV